MRRWMTIITLGALVIALVAGWGIGQLAGGGGGNDEVVLRPLATLEPTATSTIEPEPTTPTSATPAPSPDESFDERGSTPTGPSASPSPGSR